MREVCTSACDEAFKDGVAGCFETLTDCLATAQTKEEKAPCKATFVKCMGVEKEANDICSKECS